MHLSELYQLIITVFEIKAEGLNYVFIRFHIKSIFFEK